MDTPNTDALTRTGLHSTLQWMAAPCPGTPVDMNGSTHYTNLNGTPCTGALTWMDAPCPGTLTWIGAACTWIAPLVNVTVGRSCVWASCEVLTVVSAGIPDDTAGCIITAERPAELTAAWRMLTCGSDCWICCNATCCTVSTWACCSVISLVLGFLGLGFSCHHFISPWDGGSRSPPTMKRNTINNKKEPKLSFYLSASLVVSLLKIKYIHWHVALLGLV